MLFIIVWKKNKKQRRRKPKIKQIGPLKKKGHLGLDVENHNLFVEKKEVLL